MSSVSIGIKKPSKYSILKQRKKDKCLMPFSIEALRQQGSAAGANNLPNLEMLSSLILRLLNISEKYCCFFKLAPYEWDSKAHLFIPIRSGSHYIKWCVVRILFFTNLALVYRNTWKGIKTPGETIEEKMFLIFASVAYSVPSLMQIVLTLYGEKLASVMNTTLVYFKRFEELHWKDDAPPRPRLMEILTVLMLLVAVTQPYFIHLFYFYKPYSGVFVVASFILEKNDSNSWFLLVLGMLPSFWLCLIGWGSSILLIGPHLLITVYTYLFIAGEIRANTPGTYTLAELRRPFNAYMTYRELQLIITLINDMFQDLMLILVDLLMFLVVVCNFVLIVFYRKLPPAGFLVFGGYSGLSTGTLFVVYIKLGQFHESSKLFARSWKFKIDYSFGEKPLMMKRIKACRLNRVEMGSVGYFQKPNSIRIVAKIIFYTNKFLMVMRPH